jgi:hypothetical protein
MKFLVKAVVIALAVALLSWAAYYIYERRRRVFKRFARRDRSLDALDARLRPDAEPQARRALNRAPTGVTSFSNPAHTAPALS